MGENKDNTNSKNSRWRRKVGMGCCFFGLFFVVVLAGLGGGLVATGYGQKWACDAVVEDSIVWERLECSKDGKDGAELNLGKDYAEVREILENGEPEDRVAAIVELTQPSVVGVGVQGDTFSTGGILGTGFVIDEGLIATNQHVVSQRNVTYFVQVNGLEEVLEVLDIYRDPVNDIAVLRVENNSNLVPLALGDGEELKVGQQVIAIGNPLGELSGTVTTGVISGLGRSVDIQRGGFFNTTIETFDDVIQTDAAINPGNSGGPLLNLKGQVIGINFATVSGADNLSFALPVDRINSRLAELQEYGEFRMPFLGVEYRNRIVFMGRQSLVAAQVVNVAEDSPAKDSGVKEGDFIIGFNGEDLSEKNLSQYINSSDVGDTVSLNILRNQEELQIEVEIGVR